MNKQDFLKQYQTKEWYETSKRIKARDHNTCQMCGRNDVPLNVHHRYYGNNGSLNIPDDGLVTVCEHCHAIETESKANIYINISIIIDYFQKHNLSMQLLESLISGIQYIFELIENGEIKDYEYLERYFICSLFGTQVLSDAMAIKRLGYDCRDLIEDLYPKFIKQYDSIDAKDNG